MVRGRNQRAAENQLSLVNELQELRRLKHDHLVQIIGSYTDREYIAYLMLPVAQCTLGQFLGQPGLLGPDHKALIRRVYGCLSGALHYLHEKKIRHRDLSASNILIHNDEVYISDFGSAYSWVNKSGSMTRHRSTPVSPDYMAPEIAKDEDHGTASDMWSLGIIFLEMTTRLLGRRLKEYKDAISSHARKNKAYPFAYANIPALVNWLDSLSKINSEFDHDKEPLAWTRSLLRSQQDHRPSTHMLMQDILESPSFDAFCCFKCKDAFHGDFDPDFVIDKALPHTEDTYNTLSAVQHMLGGKEEATPFGGLSDNRLGSIQDWAATVEFGPGGDFEPNQGDSGRYQNTDFDIRYSHQAMFGNYEADLITSPPLQDPTAFPQNQEIFELDSSQETFVEASGSIDTSGQTEDDFQEVPLSYEQGSADKELEDSGLGFLERESVSSSDERSFRPFDEVSDRSTLDSDYESCASIGGRLQSISEEDESVDDDNKNLNDANQESLGNSEDDQGQWLGFKENSDRSDSDSESEPEREVASESKAVEARVPLSSTEPVTEVPIEKIVDAVLPHLEVHTDRELEIPIDKDEPGIEVPLEQAADTVSPLLDVQNVEILELALGKDEPGVPEWSEVSAEEKEPNPQQSLTVTPTSFTPSPGDHVDSDNDTLVSVQVDAKDEETKEPHNRTAIGLKEAKSDGVPEASAQGADKVHEPGSEGPPNEDKATELTRLHGFLPQPDVQESKLIWYQKPTSESVPEIEGKDDEPKEPSIKKSGKKEKAKTPDRPIVPPVPSKTSDRKAIKAKKSKPETVADKKVQEDSKVSEAKKEQSPKDDKAKKPTQVNGIPSRAHKTTTKKTVKFDEDSFPPRDPREDDPPQAQRRDDFDSKSENPQASTQRRSLSKHNLEKLNEGNKKSKSAREPKPRDKCIGVDVDALMSQTWEKASSAPTSVMSQATRSQLSAMLFHFNRPADIISILNKHCKDGKASAVRYILQNQPQSRARRAKYHSPLWSAVKGGTQRHNKCVRELIGADVDVNITSKRTGKSPLHVAVEHDDFKGYTTLVWLLVHAKADVNALDSDGDSPLMKLFLGHDHEPLERHRREALAILLRAGARVDLSQRATGSTPLHMAVRRQDKFAVAMLLFKGADVNAKTSSGTTPLQMTANQFRGDLSPDHAEVLSTLLQHEALVDEPAGALKRTALHLAVISGTAHAVDMLIQHGAFTKKKDKQGDDAITLAVQHAAKLVNDPSKTLDRRLDDHVEIMRLLTAKKLKWPLSELKCVVEVACSRTNTDLLEELLEKKMKPSDKFGEHGSILVFASKYGTPAAVETLRQAASSES